jgi:hypothetical protein
MPRLLKAQMKMKIWNVILQNFTVVILEVTEVCFRLAVYMHELKGRL